MARNNHREVELRLKSIAGHVQGLTRMHSEGESCGPMLLQILAIQGALDKVAGLLIDGQIDAFLDTVREGAGEGCFEDSVREIEHLYGLRQTRPRWKSSSGQIVEIG